MEKNDKVKKRKNSNRIDSKKVNMSIKGKKKQNQKNKNTNKKRNNKNNKKGKNIKNKSNTIINKVDSKKDSIERVKSEPELKQEKKVKKSRINKNFILIVIMLILVTLLFSKTVNFIENKFTKRVDVDKVEKNDDKTQNQDNEESFVNAEKIPIFTFHRIVTDSIKENRFKTNEWAEGVSMFDEQMKYLYDNGYTSLSLDELYCWYIGKCKFPKKTVVITFDDGNWDDYYLVVPVLKKYNLKGTSFIVGSRTYDSNESDYDENERKFITKDLIKKTKIEYPNFEYQSHSYNFHYVDTNKKERILNMSKEQIQEDFDNNRKFNFKYIAYPYGVYKKEVIELAKENNYLLAFTFRKATYATKDSPQYEIPRIKINGYSNVDTLKKWLNY